jgi:hypothetical protein
MRPVLVVVDVDGVVLPVDVSGDPGPTLWGGDVAVGNVFGRCLSRRPWWHTWTASAVCLE